MTMKKIHIKDNDDDSSSGNSCSSSSRRRRRRCRRRRRSSSLAEAVVTVVVVIVIVVVAITSSTTTTKPTITAAANLLLIKAMMITMLLLLKMMHNLLSYFSDNTHTHKENKLTLDASTHSKSVSSHLWDSILLSRFTQDRHGLKQRTLDKTLREKAATLSVKCPSASQRHSHKTPRSQRLTVLAFNLSHNPFLFPQSYK